MAVKKFAVCTCSVYILSFIEHTIFIAVFYPSVPGVYVPLLFIPGFDGAVYPEFYSTVTADVALYGYIVSVMNLYWPTELDNFNFENFEVMENTVGTNADRSFEMLKWVIFM